MYLNEIILCIFEAPQKAKGVEIQEFHQHRLEASLVEGVVVETTLTV